MTQDKFTVTGDQLRGRGVSLDISLLRVSGELDARLVEIGESIYLQGRESVLPSYDDRFDLHFAVESLRALAVLVGPLIGERHARAAAALARLLQEQARSL